VHSFLLSKRLFHFDPGLAWPMGVRKLDHPAPRLADPVGKAAALASSRSNKKQVLKLSFYGFLFA